MNGDPITRPKSHEADHNPPTSASSGVVDFPDAKCFANMGPREALTGTSRAVRPNMDTSTPQKAWAAQHMRGLQNYIMPTYGPDCRTLDEDAIRHDVRNSIDHGFFATLPITNWFKPDDPRREQILTIILDESKGKFHVQGSVFGANLQDELEVIERLEKMGVPFLMLGSAHPRGISAGDLYEIYRRRLDATGRPCVLYASVHEGGFACLKSSPAKWLDVLDRLADHPNAVALKISHPVPLMTQWQICHRVADRLLIAPVNLDFAPLLGREFNIQWSGQWNVEALQTPAARLAVDLLAAVAERDFERALELNNRMQPVLALFHQIQVPAITAGAHPWVHNKYYSWLSGGNGGLPPFDRATPESRVATLDADTRRRMREAFAAASLEATDAPDEQFIVGRAAWSRGVRPDMSQLLPKYSA